MALCVIAPCITTGCAGWNCDKGFDYGPARDTQGPATPRAALADWLAGGHEGAPDDGGRRDCTAETASSIIFRDGSWQVAVDEAPASGYMVYDGLASPRGRCRSRSFAYRRTGRGHRASGRRGTSGHASNSLGRSAKHPPSFAGPKPAMRRA